MSGRDFYADMAKVNELIGEASIGAEILVEAVLSQYPNHVTENAKALLIEALVQSIKSTAPALYVNARLKR